MRRIGRRSTAPGRSRPNKRKDKGWGLGPHAGKEHELKGALASMARRGTQRRVLKVLRQSGRARRRRSRSSCASKTARRA